MTATTPQTPVLITGCHRSGSTWLAEMLALPDGVSIIQEPFNIAPWGYALDGLAEHWFTYAPALPQVAALSAFDKVVKGKTRKVFPRRQIKHWVGFARRGRLIVKDPIACLSSEWLARNFKIEVIVLVRHPAAFAASLKRMDWGFSFEHFLAQELLMHEQLRSYRDEIERAPTDVVAQAALLWKCIYSVLFTYMDRNEGWIVRTHEQLSREPVREIREIYDLLGLRWSDDVQRHVWEQTRQGNPVSAAEGVTHEMKRDSVANVTSWKRTLTEDEIATVYDRTRDVCGRYYTEEDW